MLETRKRREVREDAERPGEVEQDRGGREREMKMKRGRSEGKEMRAR